tara:strand:+ start:403 stop:9654 length:9252 start_codon:yes stop_codon:yes gene_type:complete
MFEYIINNKTVFFKNEAELKAGLAEADAKGWTVEYVSGEFNESSEDDWNDGFMEEEAEKQVFTNDTAEGADVVSETTAQDTELPSEDGSSDYLKDLIPPIVLQNKPISEIKEILKAKDNLNVSAPKIKDAIIYENNEPKEVITDRENNEFTEVFEDNLIANASGPLVRGTKEQEAEAKRAETHFKLFTDQARYSDEYEGSSIGAMQKNSKGKFTIDAIEYIKSKLDNEAGGTFDSAQITNTQLTGFVNELVQYESGLENKKAKVANEPLVTGIITNDFASWKKEQVNQESKDFNNSQKDYLIKQKAYTDFLKSKPDNSGPQQLANYFAKQNTLKKEVEESFAAMTSNGKFFMNLETGQQAFEPEEDSVDMTEQLDDAIKGILNSELQGVSKEDLPKKKSLHDKLKYLWTENIVNKNKLRAKGDKIYNVRTYKDVTKEYTYDQLANLVAAGGDVEKFNVVVDTTKGPTFSQGFSNRQFEDYLSERRALNLRQEALNKLYLFNIDPSSEEKNTLEKVYDFVTPGSLETQEQFFKHALGATFGNVADDWVGYTDRDILDAQEELFSELDIKQSADQKKRFERSFSMKAAEMAGDFVPEIAKFAVASAVTGGVLGAARIVVSTANGLKTISWASRLKQLERSKKTLDQAKALFYKGIIEEVKFKGVTQGESATGGGFGFAIGGSIPFGRFLSNSIPFKLSSKLIGAERMAVAQPIFQKIIGGGIGGATSSEIALIAEDFYKAATTNEEFSDLLKQSFLYDAEGIPVGVGERFMLNAVVFGAMGIGHLKLKDFRKLSTVEAYNRKYKGEILKELSLRESSEGKMNDVEFEKLKDNWAQTENIVAAANQAYNQINLEKLTPEKNEAVYWLNNPKLRDNKKFSSEAEALAVVEKYEAAMQNARSNAEATMEAIVESGVLNSGGKDGKLNFTYTINDVSPNGAKGAFEFSKNNIEINLDKFNAGVTFHEINHAILAKLGEVNPNLPIGLRKLLEPEIKKKLKGITFRTKDNLLDLEFSEWIDYTHAEARNAEGQKLSGQNLEAYKANEYISYLIEQLAKGDVKRQLIDNGVISSLKKTLNSTLNTLGLEKNVSTKDKINLNENNANRVSDLLAFYSSFSNKGNRPKDWRKKFDLYNEMAIDIEGSGLIEIATGKEVKSIDKSVAEVMESQGMQEAIQGFKNENLAKINAEFEKMKAEGQDATTMGFNIGLKFQGIANKTLESYLKAKGLNNIDADTKYDIVADLMYEAIPKAVNTYVEGQRFIDYVKENNLSKEDAAVEFKNRNLRETSGTERFDRLYGMAKGEVKQATVTSYILGNLTNQLIGVFKMPKYENIFKNVSFDVQKVDKLQAEGGLAIPVAEQGYVDTSSPLQNVQRTRKSAEAILGLSEKTIKTVNKVVEDITKKPITDIDAKSKGDIDMGPGGKVNIVMLDNNKARVTYPDGKKEIMLGARSPLNIIKKIIKKFKSEAFQRLRKPMATEAEKNIAQQEFDVYSKLTDLPPKFIKEKILKTELGLTVEKGIYEEISKDAGELGTPEYRGFVDRAFPLFKTYLSQRAINKRFPEFKEPVLGPDGKQLRAKTAAGARLFNKKNITLAEWRKYHTGEGMPDLQVRRTTLLESLARELGFDRVMEITIDKELKKEFESGQKSVGNELEDMFVAQLRKAVDRGINNNKMFSETFKSTIEKVAEELNFKTEKVEGVLNQIINSSGDTWRKELKGEEYEIALSFLNKQKNSHREYMEFMGIDKASSDNNRLQNLSVTQGVTSVAEIKGVPVKINKAMGSRSKQEIKALAPVINQFIEMIPRGLGKIAPNVVDSNLKLGNKTFKELLGFTRDNATADLYREITGVKNENTEKFGNKFQNNSPATQASWNRTFSFMEKASGLGKNAQGKKENGIFKTYTFNKNIEAALIEQRRIQDIEVPKDIKKGGQEEVQWKKNQYANWLKKNPSVRNDLAFKESFLQSVLHTFADMQIINKGNPELAAKTAELLGSILLNNDGMGLRSYSSDRFIAFNAGKTPIEKDATSVYIKVRDKNGNVVRDKNNKILYETELINGKQQRKTIKVDEQKIANEHLNPKQPFGSQIMDAYLSGNLGNPGVIELLTSSFMSLYSSKYYQKIADSEIGATTSIPLVRKALISNIGTDKASQALIQRIAGAKLEISDLQILSNIVDNVTGKSALEGFVEYGIKRLKLSNLKAKEGTIRGNENNGFGKGSSTKVQLDNFVEKQLSQEMSESSKLDRKRIKIEDEKTGEVRFEGDKEYKTRMEELEANSPEFFLPKELAGMIERKGGAKAEDEISDSKAFMEGKKRWDDFFLPSNSEDLQGLLYKVYGKGKQGEKDMAFIKEHILRPLTRAENDLSVYRMNLVVDYKALEAEMKKLGDNKAERAAVKRVEKLGYNIDQAVRVYIWNRLGEKIPGISEVEVAQLAGAVHNSPRLQAYAKGIMNITKTTQQYPKPSANWFRSNVQYDLFTYATDGVRADFLAPWQANVDAMFDKQNLNKLEARFGGKYVYNLKQMLKRIERGKSRPESTNESFNKALDYVNGSVATIMFLNMRSAALQTISAANYVNWTDNNPAAIGKVIAENPAEFIRVAKKIWSSDALKDRRSGLKINVEEAEMAKAINQGGRTNLQGLWDAMVRVGFKPTQMADSFAIVTGGTPFYMNRMKTYEKQGLSKSEAENKAFEDFLDVTQEGQQSSQMDRVSNIQTGLMGRLVFSFNNTPFQMSRIQKKAALDLVNRRGSDRANASRLAYYAFVQSTIFYGLQQGFYATLMSDDDDKLTEKQQEEKYKDFEKRVDKLGKSVFQGILTGSGMYGKGIVTLYNTVDKAIEEYDKGYQGKDFFPILNQALSVSPTLGSKSSRLGRNWESLIYTDFTKKGREIRNTYSDFDPRNPNAKAYLSMFGTLTNIPLDRIVTKMENIQGVLDDQSSGWEKVAMTLGTPKYQLQTKEQNEADRQARIDKFYKENTPKGDRDFNAVESLKREEQLQFINELGVTPFTLKNLTTEEARVNYIIKKGLSKGLDLEIESEKYIKPKKVRSQIYKDLSELNKAEQIRMINELGVTPFTLKNLKTEEARINYIIKKEQQKTNKNKQNSLK